jgi:integrase
VSTQPDQDRARAGSPRAGLAGKLMGAVRPAFRAEIYIPAADDPVLAVRGCTVADCDRSFWLAGLCSAHARRWQLRGRPDMTDFLSDPGPAVQGRSEPGGCTVTGCHYGTAGHGICARHHRAWERAGRPDPLTWASTVPAVPAGPHQSCLLPFCSLWRENRRNDFCKSHTTRWKQLGSPPAEDFILHAQLRGRARLDFRCLPAHQRLEIQYAVQCRHDEGAVLTPPAVVNWTIQHVREAGVDSVLDHDEAGWRDLTGRPRGVFCGFLIYTHDVLVKLRDGSGWEVEYPRDVWRLDHLEGLTVNPANLQPRNRLRFDRITQPWLRALVKRWLRLRLCSGISVGTAVSDMAALTRFSQFLDTAAPDVQALRDVHRPLLERFLAWLSTQSGASGTHQHQVGSLQTFFQAIRQHSWDDTLPTTAGFFPGDTPPRPARLTRHLAEHVMAQIELPANQERWHNQDGRLVTLILIRCGLRASDACLLPFDCVLRDGQDAPYLRYRNHKMRREAAVPIDEELLGEIRAQQTRILQRWPEGNRHLFPARTANARGLKALTYHSYRGMLIRWLSTCDVRDEHQLPVHLTPHQWRHTFATRLINQDVPQEVIRVLLDHQSSEMTSHYARLSDQSVRRRWEQATKVDINGERVDLDADGPLAQAQWAKTRYGLATQTLPHGYCGLPIQKSCPHANACLTCPVFLTGPEFLPELQAHRGRTLTLIDTSTANGQSRVAQMNTQVLANLDKMIDGVTAAAPRAGAADAS